jgi:radical SAM superfamily enzyme YgiQ (UPF0313 family)
MEKYLKTNLFFQGGIMHFASRGCPYSCSFCSAAAKAENLPGEHYRLRSPQNVIREIKRNRHRYWRRGFRNVVFMDLTFGLDRNQMQNLCQLYIKEGLNRELPWSCSTRCDVISRDWAKMASRAGCAWVRLGVESGDDYIRNQVYKKNISRQQIREAAKNLRENDIMFRFSIMVGSPEDTRETIAQSIKLIEETRPTITTFFTYYPLAKTKLAERINYRQSKDINGIMWKTRIKSLGLYLGSGFKLRGPIFIWDIIKYLLSVNSCRLLPLTNLNAYIYLKQIIYNYYFQDWKQRHKHKLGL